jgi:hypothetical protein
VRRSRRSVPETPGASSSMLGTALRVNYCETRCQLIGLRPHPPAHKDRCLERVGYRACRYGLRRLAESGSRRLERADSGGPEGRNVLASDQRERADKRRPQAGACRPAVKTSEPPRMTSSAEAISANTLAPALRVLDRRPTNLKQNCSASTICP